MGGKKDKKKKAPQGQINDLNTSIHIEGLDEIEFDDNQSIYSIPKVRRYAGNEYNLSLGANVSQSNEDAQLEAKQKQKSSAQAKDQNGGKSTKVQEPQPVPFGMSEVEIPLDNTDQMIGQNDMGGSIISGFGQGGDKIISDDESDGSVDMMYDENGLPIISNEIPLKKHKPNKTDSDKIKNLIEDEKIIKENKPPVNKGVYKADSEPEPDLVTEFPKLTNVKNGLDSKANMQNTINKLPESNVEGLSQIKHESGFVPQHNKRTGYSTISQANNLLWRGVGHTVGKAVVSPASITGKPITMVLKYAANTVLKNAQPNRSHKAIPGWDRRAYGSDKTTGKDILDDFRRVPTVWSYLTAGEAEDSTHKPLPPKVTVYMEQPKQNSSRSMTGLGEVGHAMIGIEYTRESRITGRNERYNIKYGFYPTEQYVTAAGTAMLLRGAIVPGELRNDESHSYSISRTYSSTREKIETIAEKSEKYTEEGGYGYYARNCTTFVRDMFKAAGMSVGDSIFKEEKVRFSGLAHAGLTLANGANGFFDTHLQRQMKNLAFRDDNSYQGQGNLLVTKADFDRYKKTKNTSGFGQKGLIPAASAENMRRLIGDDSELGSYRYAGSLAGEDKKTANEINIANLTELNQAIELEKRELSNALKKIVTPEQAREIDMNFFMWLNDLPLANSYGPIAKLSRQRDEAYEKLVEKDKAKQEGEEKEADSATLPELVTWQQVREAYKGVVEEKKALSDHYQKSLKSDIRINKQVMNLLSMYQIVLSSLDSLYQMMSKSQAKGDLDNLREDVMLQNYLIIVNNTTAQMTPTHYESYLQIHKKPEKALEEYNKYLEMKQERQEDENRMSSIRFKWKWSGKKKKEYERLVANEYLAQQYDAAHKYMLDKKRFSQQDINYAFRLRRKERYGEEKGAGYMYNQGMTMGSAYISIFFDRVFGGMRAEACKDPRDGGMPIDDNTLAPSAIWLSDYMDKKTQAMMPGMAGIVRGMKSVFLNPTHDRLYQSFFNLLTDIYLPKVFPTGTENNKKENRIGLRISDIATQLRSKSDMGFSKTLSGIIDDVLQEAAGIPQGSSPAVKIEERSDSAGSLKKENKKKKKKK